MCKPHLAESGRIYAICGTGVPRIIKLRMVEEVEDVGTENERLSLREAYALPGRHIAVKNSWPMEYVAAQIAVPAGSFSYRATRTYAAEVWIRSAIGSAAPHSIEIRILNAELVGPWIYKLNIAAYIVGTIIAGSGQRAVASVDDIER